MENVGETRILLCVWVSVHVIAIECVYVCVCVCILMHKFRLKYYIPHASCRSNHCYSASPLILHFEPISKQAPTKQFHYQSSLVSHSKPLCHSTQLSLISSESLQAHYLTFHLV